MTVGQTPQVDHMTIQQEDLLFGKVKVLRGETRSLPKEIFLWLDNVLVPVKLEEEPMVLQQKGDSEPGWEGG